ncbi:MAG: dTMP kinase [Panacagrimonas sp.]
MSARGRLITLEGGEGAGKSTHAGLVVSWLEARGRKVVRTREPGGSPLAEAVRSVVLGDWVEGITSETELLLMFAARAAHVASLIRPALDRGEDVVCDRFVDASWAYQGAGRGLAVEALSMLEQLVSRELKPDLVLLFDLPPQLGLSRARNRGDANRFEAENLAFMTRVRDAYLARAAADPGRYAIIDASLALTEVQERVTGVLEDRLS